MTNQNIYAKYRAIRDNEMEGQPYPTRASRTAAARYLTARFKRGRYLRRKGAR